MGAIVKPVFKVAAATAGFLAFGPQGAIAGFTAASAITGALSGRPKIDDQVETSHRTRLTLDPNAPRAVVFGRTALPVQMIYWETWGTDNKTVSIVLAHAAHEIDGYDNLWLNGEVVPFTGGNATGTWAGVLFRQQNFGTSTQVAHVINLGANWTSAHRALGVPTQALTFDFAGNDELLQKGLPQRIVQQGRGAKVYDPRLDSTRGGTGAHRADDQATWEYSNAGKDIGHNPVLCELWHRLGWRDNGELIAGRGQDPDTIDMASYAAGANICEEQVGGEDRYECHGVLSLDDTHDINTAKILASCGGRIIDEGGVTGIRVAHNDTASVALGFTDSDIVGDGIDWDPMPNLDSARNTARGQYVDPAALFQAQDYTPIAPADLLAEDDEFELVDTLNFEMVQSEPQSRRLAEIATREGRQGIATFKTTLKGIQVKPQEIIALTHPNFGWVDKLFRVDAMTFNDISTDPTISFRCKAVKAGDYLEPPAVTKPTVPAVPTSGFNLANAAFARAQSVDTLTDDMVYEDFAALVSKWVMRSGGGEVTRVESNSVPGGFAVQIGNNSGDDRRWMAAPHMRMPYDPNALYEVGCIARKSAGSGTFYCGVEGVASDGVTLVNINGAASFSSQHYVAAEAVSGIAGWTVFRGYFSGKALTGNGHQHNDPTDPATIREAAAFVQPMIIANHPGVAGVTDIGAVWLYRVSGAHEPGATNNTGALADLDQIGADQVAPGSINFMRTADDPTLDIFDAFGIAHQVWTPVRAITPILAISGHRTTISATIVARAQDAGGAFFQAQGQIMRRLNGGAWELAVNIATAVNTNSTTFATFTLVDKAEEFPATGNVEYGIRVQEKSALLSPNDGEIKDYSLDVEAVLFK